MSLLGRKKPNYPKPYFAEITSAYISRQHCVIRVEIVDWRLLCYFTGIDGHTTALPVGGLTLATT
jgi:hypothetical protein